MSTTTAPSPSSERTTATHKPTPVRPGHTQAGTAAGQFAALLLLQADESSVSDAEPTALLPSAEGEVPHSAGQDTNHPAPPLGMESALQGLLGWRNYGGSAGSTSAALGTNTSQTSTPTPPPAVRSDTGNATAAAFPTWTNGTPVATAAAPSLASTVVAPTLAAASGTDPSAPTVGTPTTKGVSNDAATTAAAAASPMPLAITGAPLAAATGADSLAKPVVPGPSLAATTQEPRPPGSEPSATQTPTAAGKASGDASHGAAGTPETAGTRPKPFNARLGPGARLVQALPTGTAPATVPSTISLGLRGTPPDMATEAPRQGLARAVAGLSANNAPSEATSPSPEAAESPVAMAQPAGRSADPSGAGSGGAGADTGATTEVAVPDPAQATPSDAMEHTMERLSAQVSYWATQGAQRANLTIAGDQADPLNVTIAFEKGEINVHFETDEASVREALQTGAEEILNRLLEAKGMTLGSVSIGLGQSDSRQQHSSHQGSNPTERVNQRAGRAPQGLAGIAPTTTRPATQIISANKLDFFA
ncbi:MAG: flagellar hook-length control protein FliK [Burkholderiaceae bacterium]|nr:flagellar hook-length control protein FliK [Burkholderiaceae bacterium]